MDFSTPGLPAPHCPVESAHIHAHWTGDASQPSHPVTLSFCIRVFSNESALHTRWPKYWSFSFSISRSSRYLGLISFRMDWLDLLAVQGTLKSLLQHHSSKASILRHSEIEHVCFQISHMISIKNTFYGNRICLWWFETAGVYFLT